MFQIKCSKLYCGYENNIVLENLDFEIKEGQYLCVVGENGSGKSTLIKSILNLKSVIDGEIIFADGISPRDIGYMPQKSEIQKEFPASVYEVILSGRMNNIGPFPFYNKEDKAEVEEIMDFMNLTSLKKSCFHCLSGGQQQKVLLARAICAAKKIIILDEPTAGLDPIASMELYNLILKINKEKKVTVIMVSHDITAAVKYADKILHLNNEEVFFGTVDEYKNSSIGKKFTGGLRFDD